MSDGDDIRGRDKSASSPTLDDHHAINRMCCPTCRATARSRVLGYRRAEAVQHEDGSASIVHIDVTAEVERFRTALELIASLNLPYRDTAKRARSIARQALDG